MAPLLCRRLADGLDPPSVPSAFLFRGGDLTFRVSGVDYMAFLKNYPIPQEVKGMADGDSLRQLFCVSGLTFACVRVIVCYLFGALRVVRGATGGLSRDRR